jgi:shikimate kinase
VKRHVALVGFMASGKSTIGRRLARKLGWKFIDTDALIVREHGPVAKIFAEEGETVFRRYETAAIRTALHNAERCVIALGGGALTTPENAALLEGRAYQVFIKIRPEQILARVRVARERRPMLGPAPTIGRINELYDARMPAYERADRVVDASRRSDAEIVAEIVEWLQAS